MSGGVAIRMALEALPLDATITLRVGQLLALVDGRDPDLFEPVGTAEAADVTGMDERALRRQWTVWERIQREGGRPQVRVTRKGEGQRSDLLFDRGDLHAFAAREVGSDPQPEQARPVELGGSEAEAIADRLLSGL